MKIFDDTHPVFKKQREDVDNFKISPNEDRPYCISISLYKGENLVEEVTDVVAVYNVGDELHYKQLYAIMN